ncbi:MAG: SDR family NAD(P)-dependent oxidoreductase, partial [bacterium]
YEKAQIDPATVSYIETHGTGTSLGDPIEINGLKKAFEELYKKRGKTPPPKPHCGLGSVKTNIGHLETAAGIAGVIKVVLAMQHKTLPATVHFEELNPYIQLEGSPFYIVRETMPWEPLKGDGGWIVPRRAGVSSFGFGGANAHVVLEEYEKECGGYPPYKGNGHQDEQIFVLSARNEEGLRLYAGRMAEFLKKKAHVSLTDLAYTLQVGREAMNERLAVVASGIRELIDRLEQYCHDQADADREDVYRGRVDKEKADLLVTGKEGEEFIRIIITERKLAKLARLWVSGVDIDWKLLYLTSSPNRIALPTYPFARQRYWIPAPAGSMGHARKIQPLHPFLNGIDPEASLVQQGLAFKKILHWNDLILRDHKVRGQSTLPGVVYLEMACAAVSAIKQNHGFNLAQVVWLQPLTLKDTSKEVHLTLIDGNGQLNYEVQSSSNGHPVTHAKGTISLADSPAGRIEQRIRTEEIQAKCTQRIDKETLYATFRQTGLDYGSYFQGLDQIWINADEALGHFSLPLLYEHELRQYTLHPVLMDSALQTIAGLLTCLDEWDGQLLLPFAAERVEITHPLQASGYAYVKALGNYRFHVAILDESGLVCIKLHEVTLRESAVQLKSFFYLPYWKQSPLKSIQTPSHQAWQIRKTGEERGKDRQTVLIIYPPHGLKLVELLSHFHPKDEVMRIRLSGSATKRISPGYWEVKTDEPAGLDFCIQQISTVHVIYFLGGIQVQRIDEDYLARLEKSQEEGVLSLFRLIKSLSRRKLLHRSFQLKVITNDAYQISSEEITNPYSASLFGLARVIAKEYPAVQVSCLDIRWDEITGKASAETIKALGEAIGVPAFPSPQENATSKEAAIREGKRYIRTLEPVLLPPVPARQTPLKFQGVYLILGGAGGIGLELSRYLAETVQARLVLLGRSRLTAERKEKISAIEAKGAKVLYVQAEATDLESMREAVTTARSHFGRINGVIHSALILKDKTLENMDEETFQAALGPKVRGSVVLYEVIKGEPLDFILFFSSSQSFLSNAGQSNYAAACTFKDAFALYLNQRESYPVKIINWGYWGSVGVVASEEYNRLLAAQGFHSIEPEEGMEAVHRVLGHNVVQVVAVKAEDHALEEMGVDQHHRIEVLPEDIPSTINTMTCEVNKFLDEETQGEDEDQGEDDDQ